jgi:hypothetical protein
MNDQWIPGPTPKPPTWTVNPLPPSNDWNDTEGCSAVSGPSIVDGVVITGVPATVSSLYWQVSLNDGGAPPNFAINHLDGAGAVLGPALSISGADLSATFAGPVFLARDPVEPKEAVTLEYLEAHGAGVPEVPDNQTYGRTEGAWNLVVPAAGGTFTGVTNFSAGGAVTSGALLFAGNAVCSVPTVAQLQLGGGSLGQVPATDGNGNLSWITPVTGGPYLPLSGGTVTGSLTVNGVTTVQGPNSLVLNAPVNNARAILCSASNVMRWVLNLGDQTAEGLNNVGANFSLQAYSTTGVSLGTWLTIARADGATVFNGSGITVNGGLAVNGLLAVNSLGNFYLPGGSPGQVLSTNGSGILSWANQSGGIPDAPTDGTQYGRQSGAWTPISVPTGPPVTISDTPPSAVVPGDLWFDSVGGQTYLRYQDPNSTQWVPVINAAGQLPPASTTTLGLVKVDGTSIKAAADGTISTVLIPMGDNRLINGDMRIDQRNAGATGTAAGYTIDRWYYNPTTIGMMNWRRGGASAGFGGALVFTSLSTFTLAATDTYAVFQPIEADMLNDIGFGAAGASPMTLSFMAYSTLAGTFSGAIRNDVPNRSYPFSYTLAASTWTKVVIPIPGDTGGAWTLSGNGTGLIVGFDLGSGANYRGPANAWASVNYVGVTGAVSPVTVNGAGFYLTGVKLEIGSVATPFPRQSLAKSLADCQRYYSDTICLWAGGYSLGGYNFGQTVTFPVTMRAAPTVNFSNVNYANASGIGLSLGPTSSSVGVYATTIADGPMAVTATSVLLDAEL